MGTIFTIERQGIDPHRLYGEVVKESEELMLVHVESDFQFDGYCVIRKDDITSIYNSNSNDYCRTLMENEGLWEDVPQWVRNLPLKSWDGLFRAFTSRVVVVEAEADGDFYIGSVVTVGDGSAVIRPFDGCGQWQDLERVPLETVSILKFEDRYSTIHAKHLGPVP